MRRFIMVASLCLAGLLAGCTSDVDMANMRDNTLHSSQIQADQVTSMEEQLARFAETEADRQRSLLRLNAALDGLRGQQRALRGELEELQYRLEQADSGLDRRVTALDQRLRSLETGLGTSGTSQAPDAEIEDAVPPQADAGTEPRPVAVPPPSPVAQDETARDAEAVAERPPVQERPDAAALPPPTPEREAEQAPPAAPEPQEITAATPASPEAEPVPEPARDDPQAARLFQRARDHYQKGDFEVAIILFKQYLRQHPRAAQAGNAQYWIGESLYAQKEFNAAIVAFDEVIQEYPQNDRVASSTLKVGLSFANLGDQPNARFFLQQVQENFPNSNEAQLATEKLKQLRR